MLKKIIPVLIIMVLLYPPVKSIFFSTKFKKYFENVTHRSIERIEINREAVENFIKERIEKRKIGGEE